MHKTLDVITLFHKASSPASLRAQTLLKQISAHASETATEDQATDHAAQNKLQRTEFELNVTEDPPTSDQLRTILEYAGPEPGRPGQIVEGAADEADALKKLKEDPNRFQRPVVGHSRMGPFCFKPRYADRWTRLLIGITEEPVRALRTRSMLEFKLIRGTVFGDKESEIMKMISQLPKETNSV
ncbi:MAG: hypothetical protein LQ341_002473 [Variospora aurantia]|nr:MAG: hypothetical protein LQ341_002473 [Variospora aurantia]